MKRYITIPVITILLLSSITPQTCAQIDKNMRAGSPTPELDLFSLFNNKKYFMEMRINDVNIKAMRDFIKSFKNVQNEKWYRISDGFVSSFTQDGVQTKAIYDLAGRRHCTLRAFNEEQTPPKVKGEVKEKYYDYNIIVAYEIQFASDSCYIIKIETPTSLKILELRNDEIEVTGDYKKP